MPDLEDVIAAALDEAFFDTDAVVRQIIAAIKEANYLIIAPARECGDCEGSGCEEGCGLRGGCEDAYVGPDSHKVCYACKGTGTLEGRPIAVVYEDGYEQIEAMSTYGNTVRLIQEEERLREHEIAATLAAEVERLTAVTANLRLALQNRQDGHEGCRTAFQRDLQGLRDEVDHLRRALRIVTNEDGCSAEALADARFLGWTEATSG